MAKVNWQDRATDEIQSNHINGLQDFAKKVEDVLGMKTTSETGIPMSEVYISANDRYRIYQAPASKRNWTNSPALVVKKNGSVISSGFTVDYGGGALIFVPRLLSSDTVTVDATYINSEKTAKYLWIEEKTISAGSNFLTLSNPVSTGQKLIIKDKTYCTEWFENLHWNRSGSVITLTETSLLETLTFQIMNLG